MGQKAATGPPPRHIERRFEINRLAVDFQSRAYEFVVLAVRRCSTKGPVQAGRCQEEPQPVDQGGVAA
jgi:hypothetical protein